MFNFINQASDTTVKVVIAIAVVVVADTVGVFNPIKRWWEKTKPEEKEKSSFN